MTPDHSTNPYGHRITHELTRQIRRSGLPFDLRVVEEISSTMDIVAWGRNHLAPPTAGLALVAKNQTHGQGHSGAWLSNPADLKVTFLLASPFSEQVSLAKVGFAWATAEAIRIAASQKHIAHPFEVGVKWPNDVRIMSESRTLKVAGIMVLTPDHRREDRETCRQHRWECPPGFMLVGIGIGLTRPTVDQTVSTHLGSKKLSEIATTLDQWTAHPVAWSDILLPLIHKVEIVDSFLREDAGDKLARTISRRFALGKDDQVILELIGEPSMVVTVRGATGVGLHIERDGKPATIPFDRIVRFTPCGYGGV